MWTVVQRAVRETGEDIAPSQVVRAIATITIDLMLSEASSGIDEGSGGLRVCERADSGEPHAQWRRRSAGRSIMRRSHRHTLEHANAVIQVGDQRRCARSAHLVGYTLGTGVGGAVILDGRLWRTARDVAGELGHRVVVPGGHRCGCGGGGASSSTLEHMGLGAGTGTPAATHFARGPEGIRLASEAARAGDEVLLGRSRLWVNISASPWPSSTH